MTKNLYFSYAVTNLMLQRFNLEMTALGLINKDRIILADNTIALDFLRLDKNKIATLVDEKDLFKYISECAYFNPNIFKITLVKKYILALPPETKKMFIKFMTFIRETKPPSRYKYTQYTDVYDKVLDNFIKRYHLTNSVMSLQDLRKLLSDKLNGKLVMEWLPDVKPGPLLGDMMKQFKADIETKCPYDVYLFKNSKETIKNDFILFFTV